LLFVVDYHSFSAMAAPLPVPDGFASPSGGSPRVWIDGCFDLFHYGHANAIRQAKLVAGTLVVGIHSDAEILRCKGLPVMSFEERYAR
jgi:cytidyltransferase-like protein